jgi:hypothetical protein
MTSSKSRWGASEVCLGDGICVAPGCINYRVTSNYIQELADRHRLAGRLLWLTRCSSVTLIG